MQNLNTLTFWDGDNFVIVLKHCDKEEAKKAVATVIQALSAEEGPDSYAVPISEPAEEMPVIPQEEEPVQEYRLNTKKYHGLTPQEALKEDGKKAYGNLAYRLARTKDPKESAAIKDALDEYFKNTFARAKKDPYAFAQEKFTMELCQDFFLYFGSVLTDEEKKKVVDTAGMTDFDTFLKTGTLTQLQSLIATVLETRL